MCTKPAWLPQVKLPMCAAAVTQRRLENPLFTADHVDHEVLMHRLEHLLGVHGTPLAWFRSYLSGRSQRVLINGEFSSSQRLVYGVPQGSVLGPLLFTVYILPLGKLIRQYGLDVHIYADDTQLYVSVCPTSEDGINNAVSKLENCVSNVQSWMSKNFLKLNADKTEVMVIGFRAQLTKFNLPSVTVAGVDVPVQTNPVRNLGVMFDSGMTMSCKYHPGGTRLWLGRGCAARTSGP